MYNYKYQIGKNVTVGSGYCLSECDTYFELVTVHGTMILITSMLGSNNQELELQVLLWINVGSSREWPWGK